MITPNEHDPKFDKLRNTQRSRQQVPIIDGWLSSGELHAVQVEEGVDPIPFLFSLSYAIAGNYPVFGLRVNRTRRVLIVSDLLPNSLHKATLLASKLAPDNCYSMSAFQNVTILSWSQLEVAKELITNTDDHLDLVIFDTITTKELEPLQMTLGCLTESLTTALIVGDSKALKESQRGLEEGFKSVLNIMPPASYEAQHKNIHLKSYQNEYMGFGLSWSSTYHEMALPMPRFIRLIRGRDGSLSWVKDVS